MPIWARKLLSIALVLVVFATGAVQSSRALLHSSSASVQAGHTIASGPHADHGSLSSSRSPDGHGASVPMSPDACVIVCLEAFPDHYLASHGVRVGPPDDTSSYPFPLLVAPAWLTSKQLQAIHLAAQGPPFEAWAPRQSGAPQVFMRTQRLRI